MAEGDLVINGEEISAVTQCLLTLPGVDLDDIRTVISHPQALSQCEGYLRRHRGWETRSAFDTAGAARTVRERGRPSLAAIASRSAAAVYGLEVLEEGIQDVRSNYTRFVEVAVEATKCSAEAACKTSLLLTTGHRPGNLGDVLQVFSSRGINLTKLESRPIPGQAFQYRFYLDVEGNASSSPLAEAIEEVRQAGDIHVLGTYVRGDAKDVE